MGWPMNSVTARWVQFEIAEGRGHEVVHDWDLHDAGFGEDRGMHGDGTEVVSSAILCGLCGMAYVHTAPAVYRFRRTRGASEKERPPPPRVFQRLYCGATYERAHHDRRSDASRHPRCRRSERHDAGHWPRPYRADLRQFRRREIHGSRCDGFGDRLEGPTLCERAGRADGDPRGGWRPRDHRRLADPARRPPARDLLRGRGLLLP